MTKFVGLFIVVAFASGCASATEPRLSYEGHSSVLGVSPTVVEAVVTVRNTGSAVANIPTRHCPLWIAAFATPERNGEPLWRSAGEQCVSIPMILPPIVVAPGDFIDFTVRASLPASLNGKRVFLTMAVPNASPVPVGQVLVK